VSGKVITMPCGHRGECIVGQFAVCSIKGCDGTAREGASCVRCGGSDLYDFVSPLAPNGAIACRLCGHVLWEAQG
jgi:hypothetical protein